MEISFCQSCKTAQAQLLCKCSDIYLCEQCIGTHIMQVFNVKHKPVKIATFDTLELETFVFSPEIESAIHSKLSNEILELAEFRKLALQKISELLQEAEKQLLETAEKVMVSLSDLCEIATGDISNALSLLNYRSLSNNYILDLFKKCNSIESVRDTKIIHKTLEYTKFNVSELINTSLMFNIQITNDPAPISPSKISADFEKLPLSSISEDQKFGFTSSASLKLEVERTASEYPYKYLPITRKTINDIELELIAKEINLIPSRTVSRDVNCMKQSLAPCVYSFVPNTNRIVWYNVKNDAWEEKAIPNHLFLKDSAWSVCEGGKIIATGGYENAAKDSVFIYNLDSNSEEKAQNMPNKRFKHAQVAFGHFVYVIGGVGTKGKMRSVDKFNLLNGKWKKSGNMSCAREYPGACSHDGKIYIIGGVSCQSIEVFNPLNKKFSLLNLKISVPGRNCLFSYDDYILILRGDTLTKFITKTNTTIEKSKVMHCDWVMRGDPYITNNLCYFFFFQELFKLDLNTNAIKLVGQIP